MLGLQRQRSPALPDVHGPPSPVGFGISGLWVRRLLGQRGGNRHRVSLLACNTRSRRTKGHLQERQDARCRPMMQLIVV